MRVGTELPGGSGGAQPATPDSAGWTFVAFRTPVRGYRYAARPPQADHPRSGQRVLLHHERGHPRDPWAVAIWTRAADRTPWRIGYLERAVAARLGPWLDAGGRVEASVLGWWPEPSGRWRRPVLLVGPASPAATAAGAGAVAVSYDGASASAARVRRPGPPAAPRSTSPARGRSRS